MFGLLLGLGDKGCGIDVLSLLCMRSSEAMANEGFKLSKGSTNPVSTGAFFKSRDDYRKHPILNGHLKRATPGLGIALGLFGVYLIVDGISSKFSAPKDHH